MFISLKQLLRIGLLFTAIGAALILLPVTAHAGSSFRREMDSGPTGANRAAIVINIDKSRQQMSVYVDGVERYEWPVSTGRAGYSTPSGTYTATSMNEIWYSKQWDNAPMPHSIFFIKDGHAIHGSYDVKNLGRPASHGCVRVSPKDAAILYALVEENGLENTRVVVTGVTPGGEYKIAEEGTSSRGANKVDRRQTSPREVKRSVGVPSYDGSQADSGSPWPWSW
jgi:hypothetical protein